MLYCETVRPTKNIDSPLLGTVVHSFLRLQTLKISICETDQGEANGLHATPLWVVLACGRPCGSQCWQWECREDAALPDEPTRGEGLASATRTAMTRTTTIPIPDPESFGVRRQVKNRPLRTRKPVGNPLEAGIGMTRKEFSSLPWSEVRV